MSKLGRFYYFYLFDIVHWEGQKDHLNPKAEEKKMPTARGRKI
jgi:hypothetical protein